MPTLLQENILRAWDLKDIEELVIRANSVPQPAFGKLLPEVTAAAEEGDAMASRILDQAGQMLAELARIVGARMFADGQPLQVAMSGGVFANAARVREAFAKALLPAPVLAEVVDDRSREHDPDHDPHRLHDGPQGRQLGTVGCGRRPHQRGPYQPGGSSTCRGVVVSLPVTF